MLCRATYLSPGAGHGAGAAAELFLLLPSPFLCISLLLQPCPPWGFISSSEGIVPILSLGSHPDHHHPHVVIFNYCSWDERDPNNLTNVLGMPPSASLTAALCSPACPSVHPSFPFLLPHVQPLVHCNL